MRWDLAGNMLGAQPSPQSPRGSIGGMPLTPMAATQSPVNDMSQMYPTKGMALDAISGPSADPWAAIAARNQPDEIRDPVITSAPSLSPQREKLVQAVMNSTSGNQPQPQPQAQSFGVSAPQPQPSPSPSMPSFAPPQAPRPQGPSPMRQFRPMFGGGGFRQSRPRPFMRPMRPGG